MLVTHGTSRQLVVGPDTATGLISALTQRQKRRRARPVLTAAVEQKILDATL